MRTRYRFLPCFLLLAFLLSFLPGCSEGDAPEGKYTITDAEGRTIPLKADPRVVACYGSFAECWLLAGGTLSGVTEDALSERNLAVGNAQTVGTVHHIQLEALIALEPDLVLLSAEVAAHREVAAALAEVGIPYGLFRTETFPEYKALMQQLCAITGRQELYRTHVLEVEERIEAILAKIPKGQPKTALLMRAHSGGIKAKGEDTIPGRILAEFGISNLAEEYPSLLEDISMELLVKEDPAYILAFTMGKEDAAHALLEEALFLHPAWAELSAVKSGNYCLLPKALFHQKPNHRWDESYAYLAKLLYPEIFE